MCVVKMNSYHTTVEITDLVPVVPGVYASESCIVTVNNDDSEKYVIHVCRPVWTNGLNTGLDVTSYTYSRVTSVDCKKIFIHSVADVQLYCLFYKHRCYCTRLLTDRREKTVDSIKHTLMLYPFPIVASNISWSDIVRTETCGQVIWNRSGEDVLSYKQQQLLNFVSKKLYPKNRTSSPLIRPRSHDKNIDLGSIDLGNIPCIIRRNGALGRVGDMLFVCRDFHARDVNHSHHVSSTECTIYFPCRGGPSMALDRLKYMLLCLHEDEKDAITLPVSCPLTMCDSCNERAVVLETGECVYGSLLCQPIIIRPTEVMTCNHQQAGPVHLFSIELKEALWVERDVLCSRGEQRAETLLGRIANTLKACVSM